MTNKLDHWKSNQFCHGSSQALTTAQRCKADMHMGLCYICCHMFSPYLSYCSCDFTSLERLFKWSLKPVFFFFFLCNSSILAVIFSGWLPDSQSDNSRYLLLTIINHLLRNLWRASFINSQDKELMIIFVPKKKSLIFDSDQDGYSIIHSSGCLPSLK